MKNLKRNIAIVCGGDSSEHDVSLRSAQGLFSFFDKERYNVYIVDVKGVDWQVELPGGALEIEWRPADGHVLMTGPATTVFRGEVELN